MLENVLGIGAIVATIINLIYSYHERVENFFWNWPAFGLIAIGLFSGKAYATGIMLLIQAVISTHGFFVWTKNRSMPWGKRLLCLVYDSQHKTQQATALKISIMTLQEHLFAATGIVLSFMLAYGCLHQVDDISPFIDASTFGIFSVATVLLNFKRLEGWLYYVLADGYACILSYETSSWYNITALLLFIGLDLFIYRRWLFLSKSED